MFYSLSSIIEKSVSQFFWAIQYALFKIILVIVQAFEFIAGLPVEAEESHSTQNLLEEIFKGNLQKAFEFMAFVGLLLFIVCIIIGLIKAQYNKEQPQASKKVLYGSIKAIGLFVFIPFICIIFVNVVGEIMNQIVNGVSSSLLESSNGIGSSINTGIFDVARSNFSDPNITWESGYDNSVMSLFGSDSYNYVLGILISCIVLYALLIATINIVERLINLALLYLSAPLVIATSSLDEGARFNIWKDKILSKYLGIMGNVLSMIVYLYISKIANGILGSPKGLDFRSVAYLCIIIGGAFMCSKGNVLIAGLISHNEATQEGLSQQQTSGMLRGGMALGGAVLGGANHMAKKKYGAGLGGSNESGSGEAGNNLAGGGAGGSATKGLGIGSSIKGGLGAVRRGGLLAVAGGTAKAVGRLANPMSYVRAFRKDDNEFKKAVGEKDNKGIPLTNHEQKRLDKMARKEGEANAKQEYDNHNLKNGQSMLQRRANFYTASKYNDLEKGGK